MALLVRLMDSAVPFAIDIYPGKVSIGDRHPVRWQQTISYKKWI
jgi:hypothetical protein